MRWGAKSECGVRRGVWGGGGEPQAGRTGGQSRGEWREGVSIGPKLSLCIPYSSDLQ